MLVLKSLHILCFGDSLTAGYSKSGALYHPYAIALKSSLEIALPSTIITLDVEGLPGDQVISPPGGFLPRMDILYEANHSKYAYDFAIILGGTNDLSMSSLSKPIFQSLCKVWDIPLQNGTKVLALTVPESGDAPALTVRRRDALNALILKKEAADFYTFDLHTAVPYFAMPENERKEIWDDTVHFTAKGYDRIGRLLARQILDILDSAPKSEVEGETKQELKKREQIEERNFVRDSRRLLRSGRVLG